MLADPGAWIAIPLLAVQVLLLAVFSFFSFFNYLYGIASLWQRPIRRVPPSARRVAVVIVAFNEEHVLEATVRACDALSHPNRLTVLADDSTDPRVVESLRGAARARGCKRLVDHGQFQQTTDDTGQLRSEPIEIWESPDFVLMHRPKNVGFKAGSLVQVQEYLCRHGIDLMYLLDADWHPQQDAIERTLEVLEADPGLAFVQTKRVSFPQRMNLFQKYVTIIEEGCYFVDFAGRQTLGHPILFSGCCTLFRLDAVAAVGGFTPGHLTEDLDLSNRFWLKGWRGVYLQDVVNQGEVPFTYDHFRRQQERWASGSARAFKAFLWPILTTRELSWVHKLSVLRQNAYFTTTLLTAVAILLGMLTCTWLSLAWNSYGVELYLHAFGQFHVVFGVLLYWCLLSNLVEPTIMIVFKKKATIELCHLPMMVWYAWSVIPTYVIGNIKGLTGISQDWFRTPKVVRGQAAPPSRIPPMLRIINVAAVAAAIAYYFSQMWVFGGYDQFAILVIPAFILAAVQFRD